MPPWLGIVQGVEFGIERGIVTEGIQGLPFLLAGQPDGGVLLERIEVDRQRGRLKTANKQVQSGQLLFPIIVIELQQRCLTRKKQRAVLTSAIQRGKSKHR